MTQYFFDTSALVKLYHEEPGDIIVLPIYYSKNEIFISEISRIEFISATHKKFRNKEINTGILKITMDRFISDFNGRFHVIPLASSLADIAFDLIAKHGRSKHLITLDAIQLASFLAIADDDTTFVSADDRFNSLVKQMSFNVLEWKY
jgi:predicted nucleic acid-binding protein